MQVRDLVVERQVIGITQYDLQSNAAIDDRMAGNGDAVSAAWTMSLDVTPFEDRGTGYNFYDGEVWGEQPYERIENVRIGWPSINHLGDGRVVISHAGIDTPFTWCAAMPAQARGRTRSQLRRARRRGHHGRQPRPAPRWAD